MWSWSQVGQTKPKLIKIKHASRHLRHYQAYCFHAFLYVFTVCSWCFHTFLLSYHLIPPLPPLHPCPRPPLLLTLLVFSCFPTIFAIQSSTRFFNPYVFHMCISYEFHIWLKMFDMSMILQDSKVSSFPRCSGPDLDQGAARGPKGGVRSPEPLHPYSSNYPQIRAFLGLGFG